MEISTHQAPDVWHSGAPYNPVVRVGEFLFVSGSVPVDPETGQSVGNDIEAQTDRVLRNIALQLEAAGSSMGHVVKTTVFLTDSRLVSGMNGAYRSHFPGHLPARSTVQVGPLARLEWLVEIEAIAVVAD